jgi:hypothetical protein
MIEANGRLIFFPRPSRGWLALFGAAIVVFALAIVFSFLPGAQGTLTAFVTSLILQLGVGVPLLTLGAWFPSMRYELDERVLSLRYGRVIDYRIPVDRIRSYRFEDLQPTPWSSLRLPGVALFRVRYANVGPVRMCASAARRRILLLDTDDGLYGVTPADEESFIAALRARIRGVES